ncbi:invasion associated locus B family protein [Aliiroseovarius sp.]|uniref:invasion associated locus B family protein n=1 Tax=Aliiroseovarius sp. TaxID=1872442 RepID=UPI003BAD0A63
MKADLLKPLTLAALFALSTASTGWAQDSGEAAPAEGEDAAAEAEAEADAGVTGLDMGTDAERQPGQIYVAEVHGDWERRCAHNPGGDDPCQMYQLLKDADGTPVAEINIVRLPEGSQALAGATFVAPLETLLTEKLTIAVDSGGGKEYAFRVCTAQGCLVQLGFGPADIAAMKAGSVATATIVPAVAPDQRVQLPISLTGFTAAFDSLQPPVLPQQ